MIYLTGDIHGDPARLSSHAFPAQKEMTKGDYVIILGDFGLVWNYTGMSSNEEYWLKWLEDKPFTTLFIDGNHENHDRLDAYPVTEWKGGKVHQIMPSVLHLMRGQVFMLEGCKFFTFGGARCHDIRDGILDKDEDAEKIRQWNKDYTKLFRINKVSWWERELPSEEEMEEGKRNLEQHGYEVDYVLTHCPSASTTALLGQGLYEQDILTEYLQEIRAKMTFKRWYFGHYHIDYAVNAEEHCLYEQVVRIV